ncbi:MAG: hypothetical protein KME56_15285 [Candidatus Thiodiazotropha sp. (ex Ctena orbiculata)]|uniref:Uncharacterized protein n=1 Tax=Candidatus Thiodiazotropha taylori TaxID=2792791 RepID=A0A944QTS5_9GAMM|nr:hypothetical protein [Candidatus Thiodiazotropha taylori]MBT2990243.1 hypothetical protein [Candidatus Thiodiazotropha taylori]MBT2997975.1 hypothetical protein [Candidatus Thiodiazotropha taylori]MBT3001762.1 hypothetical protein [Candidatus Thiodiazotropha taylori]MBT3028425.1 hypothetical protein [Candidatus Thiodiazotropha taylori]
MCATDDLLKNLEDHIDRNRVRDKTLEAGCVDGELIAKRLLLRVRRNGGQIFNDAITMLNQVFLLDAISAGKPVDICGYDCQATCAGGVVDQLVEMNGGDFRSKFTGGREGAMEDKKRYYHGGDKQGDQKPNL